MFVKSKVAKIKLACTPITNRIPNMPEIMFTTNVRAIEMFRVEKGMVLIMVVGALAKVGSERREKRTKISEAIMKMTVRLAHMMWEYIITWEFEPSTSMSNAKKNGGFPG